MADAIEAAIRTAAEGLEAAESGAADESGNDGGESGNDGGDSGSGDATETGTESSDTPADGSEGDGDAGDGDAGDGDKAAAEPKAGDEDAELARIEKELTDKTPNLRRGNIPVSRHQAVLTRERNKHKTEKQELETRLSQFDTPDTRERIAAATLAERNPRVFLNDVLLKDPRYQQEIDRIIEQRTGKGAPPKDVPASTATTVSADSQRPQPDVILSDGTVVYSREQNEKLVEWHIAQQNAQHEKQIKELKDMLTPLADRDRFNGEMQQAYRRQHGILSNAREKWPGFKDNEKAIREYLMQPGNEKVQLEEAYRAVVVPMLLTDREKIRAEERANVLKEIKGNKAGSQPRPNGEPPVADKAGASDMDPIEKAIRDSIKGMK